MHHPNLERRLTRWYERLTLFRAIGTIIGVAFSLVMIAGVLERIAEPETFKTLGLSYWWAATTVTTVGYGDVVPHSAAGRAIAVLLMVIGLSLIPTLTSVIVSTLMAKRTQADRETATQERDEYRAALERIEERLARLDPGGQR